MRKLIVFTVLALAIPAAALASGTPSQNAAAQAACQAQRTALGTATFNLTYVGTTNANRANAFGKCVLTGVRKAQANAAAANATCRTARAAGLAAFKAKYGSFGKCVSQTTSALNNANNAATTAAAKACATERAAGLAAFTTKYGTGANSKSNAFGKCVSSKVKTTP